MKKIIYTIFSMIAVHSIAQENLVPNPSFEQVEKKIKEAGEIELAYPWTSATLKKVDLYSADAKNKDFGVPENAYGEEKAQDGNNYVGLNIYGYRGRAPKGYLQTELTKELTAGKKYCMKFFVSFSDRSKYATNNIGIYVSNDAVTSTNEGDLNFKPQIMKLKNSPIDKQFDWVPICGLYEAQGGEKFITIGNFMSEENTVTERVRQSREFSGAQIMDGYYYLDNVSVIDMEGQPAESCVCEKIAGGKLETEFKSFSTSEKDKESSKAESKVFVNSDGTTVKPGEKVAAQKKEYSPIYQIVTFEEGSKDIEMEGEVTLDQIVDYLKKNPTKKLKATGHANKSESNADKLSKGRAFAIKKYLDAKGLTGRIVLDSNIEEQSKPENRKVTFEFVD